MLVIYIWYMNFNNIYSDDDLTITYIHNNTATVAGVPALTAAFVVFSPRRLITQSLCWQVF